MFFPVPSRKESQPLCVPLKHFPGIHASFCSFQLHSSCIKNTPKNHHLLQSKGLTHHSTGLPRIGLSPFNRLAWQPVNSNVSPHFSLASSVLFPASAGAPVLIGSPLGLAQAARLSWLAGRCAFSPCVFVLASAQLLPLHSFFVGCLAALRLFGARFVARIVSLSLAFGYAELIVLSWGSSVLPFVRRVPCQVSPWTLWALKKHLLSD